MTISITHDPGQARKITFRCLCGSVWCHRTEVARPDGGKYRTEFIECSMCRLMYHWPGALPDYSGDAMRPINAGHGE